MRLTWLQRAIMGFLRPPHVLPPYSEKEQESMIFPLKNSLSPSGYISGIVREDERVNDPSKMSQLVNGLRSIEQIE